MRQDPSWLGLPEELSIGRRSGWKSDLSGDVTRPRSNEARLVLKGQILETRKVPNTCVSYSRRWRDEKIPGKVVKKRVELASEKGGSGAKSTSSGHLPA